MEEIWKDIKGYEGSYQVSNLGRVKSLNRYVKRGSGVLFVTGKILSGRRRSKKQKMQYLCVLLNGKNFNIHQLVAMAFLNHTPCGHKLVVDHINDDKLDNRVENLQIVTQRENAYKTQGNYSSKFKGVDWCKSIKKWRVRTRIKGKEFTIGYFKDENEAGKAYLDFIEKLKL